jgi:hypothetical protein
MKSASKHKLLHFALNKTSIFVEIIESKHTVRLKKHEKMKLEKGALAQTRPDQTFVDDQAVLQTLP